MCTGFLRPALVNGDVPVTWIGQSGRLYSMVREQSSEFKMRQDALYVLTLGSQALWAGTAQDLVSDGASRDRFRLAVRSGGVALRFDAPTSADEAAIASWDIANGKLTDGLRLAG